MNRLVKIGFGSPVVVAALQSPHLLNIWRNSRYWNLYYELLGDHEGFTEAHEIRLPCVERENLHSELVSAAIVTSPLQLKNALNRYPASLVFWLVHTGCYPNILPIECVESIHGIITLTEAVMRIQLRHKPILGKKITLLLRPSTSQLLFGDGPLIYCGQFGRVPPKEIRFRKIGMITSLVA